MKLLQKQKLSPAEVLVAEACALALTIRKQETRRRLTASAFVAAALRYAGCGRDRIEALRAALTTHPERAPDAHRFLQRLTEAYRNPGVPEPAAAVSHVFFADSAGAGVELHDLGGFTRMEAAALAALRATEDPRTVWGDLTDVTAHRAAVGEMRERLQVLYDRIGREVPGQVLADLSVGLVPLTPPETLGERLTTFLTNAPAGHLRAEAARIEAHWASKYLAAREQEDPSVSGPGAGPVSRGRQADLLRQAEALDVVLKRLGLEA